MHTDTKGNDVKSRGGERASHYLCYTDSPGCSTLLTLLRRPDKTSSSKKEENTAMERQIEKKCRTGKWKDIETETGVRRDRANKTGLHSIRRGVLFR